MKLSYRLPIEDATGEEIVAEGSSTKKKDAVVACAYEACRIIDAHGMLRNAMHGKGYCCIVIFSSIVFENAFLFNWVYIG